LNNSQRENAKEVKKCKNKCKKWIMFRHDSCSKRARERKRE